jgi:hypothetical protein
MRFQFAVANPLEAIGTTEAHTGLLGIGFIQPQWFAGFHVHPRNGNLKKDRQVD